jgi:hypothetical protein
VKKSLLMIGILALACGAASAQTFSLGFLSYDKTIQYCDYETISEFLPFAAGTHVLTSGCGYPYDGAMVGLKASIPLGTAVPLTGAGLALADNVIDASCLCFSGANVEWFTKTKATTKAQLTNNKYGWEFFLTFGGGSDYLGNYGFLTTHLGPASHGLAAQKSSFHGAREMKHKM